MLFVRAVVSPAGAGLILAASVAFATGALRNHYKKPASLDLRVSRDEVTHEEPATPDRFVDESAMRPRDRPALQASLEACRTLPKPEGDTAPAASP